MKAAFALILIFMTYSQASYSHEYGAFSTSTLPRVTDSVNRYCSEAHTAHSAQCLSAYLAYRCTVNLMFEKPQAVYPCIEATDELVKLLDLTQTTVEATEAEENARNKLPTNLRLHQIAFSHQLLLAFLKPSESFKNTVQDYQRDFEDSYRFSHPHSLWERTLENHQGSREQALLTMITLFQDAASQGYFNFVADASRQMTKENRSTAIQNLTSLNPFFVSLQLNRVQSNLNPNYALYPNLHESDRLNPLLHHFYTPAYLSLKLKKMGFKESTAFYASLLFNTTYEFIKLDQKMKTKRWPLFDPLPFQARQYPLQVQKIYTGYIGALFGVGKETSALSFDEFASKLSASPSSFITSLCE